MLADTLENTDQIVVGVDLVQTAAREQALCDTDVFGAELWPSKEPVAAAHGNNTQGSLQMIQKKFESAVRLCGDFGSPMPTKMPG